MTRRLKVALTHASSILSAALVMSSAPLQALLGNGSKYIRSIEFLERPCALSYSNRLIPGSFE